MQIDTRPLEKIDDELREGMALAKCRKCGCMKDTLESLSTAVSVAQVGEAEQLQGNISRWQQQMEPIKYACLGCEYCFPAVTMNAFNAAFPDEVPKEALSCAFEVKENSWPVVPGEYKVLCDNGECPVAISTLGSPELTERLADAAPEHVCIIGKTETENIGIDKLIKNTITNRAIRFLLLVGNDPKGHLPGQTLLSLSANGINESMRVIGSKGKRPILRNVTEAEVESFRRQVQVVDMIGYEDVKRIVSRIQEFSMVSESSCGCSHCDNDVATPGQSNVPVIQAREPARIQMDKAGYFVILPEGKKGIITVEHYSYDDKLLRVIEGIEARNLCWTIIEHNLVTQLSHAAYLGKELSKAELSLKLGLKYVQDGA